jgi:quinol monooxygenase YgiN
MVARKLIAGTIAGQIAYYILLTAAWMLLCDRRMRRKAQVRFGEGLGRQTAPSRGWVGPGLFYIRTESGNVLNKGGVQMDKFGLYTKFTTHEGQRDSLVGMLLEAASGMESVEGCDLYIVNIPENEPDSVWVTEIWNDPSAHHASLSLEQSKVLIQKARPFIAGVEQIKLHSVGGKGI